MSDAVSASDSGGLLVEVHTLFLASSRAEAEALLDQVMDISLAVVCPPDEARLATCSHCRGTLVNPDEGPSGADAADRWSYGLPCAACADSQHPGQEMVCAREHAGGATIHPDGAWVTSEDRRLALLLHRLLAALDEGDVDLARAQVLEQLGDLSPSSSGGAGGTGVAS